MRSLVIREARADESSAVAGLTERAFAAGPYGHLPVSVERRRLIRAVDERAATGVVLVAEVLADGGGATLVGTASLLRASSPHARLAVADEAELRLLAVDPGSRGHGVGAALAAAAQEEAHGWGAPAVVLDTGKLNHGARRLYERLGYTPFDRSGTPPSSTGARIDHIDYRVPLRRRDDIVVRLVRDDEVDAVGKLSLRAYEHDYDVSETYRASILDVGSRAREHQVWVAADAADGRLLGTVATPRRGGVISPLAAPGELDFRLLAVDPAARGRGIGATLTEHAIELARLRGLERVVINSGPQMTGAHRLYERLGFARLTEREREIVDGGRTVRLLAFTIDVPGRVGTLA